MADIIDALLKSIIEDDYILEKADGDKKKFITQLSFHIAQAGKEDLSPSERLKHTKLAIQIAQGPNPKMKYKAAKATPSKKAQVVVPPVQQPPTEEAVVKPLDLKVSEGNKLNMADKDIAALPHHQDLHNTIGVQKHHWNEMPLNVKKDILQHFINEKQPKSQPEISPKLQEVKISKSLERAEILLKDLKQRLVK